MRCSELQVLPYDRRKERDRIRSKCQVEAHYFYDRSVKGKEMEKEMEVWAWKSNFIIQTVESSTVE